MSEDGKIEDDDDARFNVQHVSVPDYTPEGIIPAVVNPRFKHHHEGRATLPPRKTTQDDPSKTEEDEEKVAPATVVGMNTVLLHTINEIMVSFENNTPYVEYIPSLWDATRQATAAFLSMADSDLASMIAEEQRVIDEAAARTGVLIQLVKKLQKRQQTYLLLSHKRCLDMQSFIAGCLGRGPVNPPLRMLERSVVKLQFPRYFVSVIHHTRDEESNAALNVASGQSQNVQLLPTMFHLWHNIVDKPSDQYEVPISCGDMQSLLVGMKKCPTTPMDPGELMKMYAEEWMKTYLKGDPARIPEETFEQLREPLAQKEKDHKRHCYIALHGGYLLKICHTVVQKPETRSRQPGLRFVIRFFT